MGQFWVKTIALSGSVLGDRQHGGISLKEGLWVPTEVWHFNMVDL